MSDITLEVARASMDEARADEREAIFEKLRLEVRAAFDNWTNSGHQKHTRAVFRNLEKVYARITGREFVR